MSMNHRKAEAEIRARRRRARDRRIFAAILVTLILISMLGGLTGAFIVSSFAQVAENAPTETAEPVATTEPEETKQEETKAVDFRTVEIKTDGRTLDKDIQETMVDMCEKYDAPFALVLAVAEQESRFNPNAVSATNDHGTMQINSCNFGWLRKRGIEPLDRKGNIEAGVLMLSEAVHTYGDYHYALMAYNGGDAYAKKHWSQGTHSSTYSRAVMERFNKWDEYLRGV